ncbi:THO complex, subunit 5 [Wolffia australiana]
MAEEEEEESKGDFVDESNAECSPHELLEESRKAMEEIAAKMILVSKEGGPKSELRELFTQMSLVFITLRQVNRSILLEEDRVKEETEKAKAPVDITTLQLHNLTYEKNHYLKAIKACKDFRSKYPNIELVSEEEFFRDAPDDIKGGVLSNDGAQDLMLKRLNYELHQRKELCKLREKLELRKKELVERLSERKKFLSSLPSHLKSLKKASLPVQQQLGVLHTKKSKQNSAAELLPLPLYILYTQLLSQKEAFGESIELEILGSIKDAQVFAQQQASKDSGTSVEAGKLDDDLVDDEDEGQRRRKRPKKTSSKDTVDSSGIFQSHPLYIFLHMFDDESPAAKPLKLVSLRFEFLVKLNVVCVGVEGGDQKLENMLCNLFPDDVGIELPHEAAKTYAGDNINFQARSLRPFTWAQHLGGMDILPESPPLLQMSDKGCSPSGLSLYRHQNRVQTFLQRLRSRIKAHTALQKQMESLKRLTFPSISCTDVPWALHSPSCTMEQWSAPGSTSVDVGSLDNSSAARSNREEGESAREDGELPSASQLPVISDDPKPVSPGELSRSLNLMSKRPTASNLGKSMSFKRHDEITDLVMDWESDEEQQVAPGIELEGEDISMKKNWRRPWEEYGLKVFSMVLSRIQNGKKMKLEAKVEISVEYPLRPPNFSLSMATDLLKEGGGSSSSECCSAEWFNELRAMEAEVNVHIMNMVSEEWEYEILANQICCLAMLFDMHVDQLQTIPPAQRSISLADLGPWQPVIGSSSFGRSARGRDRRKLLSWKKT